MLKLKENEFAASKTRTCFRVPAPLYQDALAPYERVTTTKDWKIVIEHCLIAQDFGGRCSSWRRSITISSVAAQRNATQLKMAATTETTTTTTTTTTTHPFAELSRSRSEGGTCKRGRYSQNGLLGSRASGRNRLDVRGPHEDEVRRKRLIMSSSWGSLFINSVGDVAVVEDTLKICPTTT